MLRAAQTSVCRTRHKNAYIATGQSVSFDWHPVAAVISFSAHEVLFEGPFFIGRSCTIGNEIFCMPTICGIVPQQETAGRIRWPVCRNTKAGNFHSRPFVTPNRNRSEEVLSDYRTMSFQAPFRYASAVLSLIFDTTRIAGSSTSSPFIL